MDRLSSETESPHLAVVPPASRNAGRPDKSIKRGEALLATESGQLDIFVYICIHMYTYMYIYIYK